MSFGPSICTCCARLDRERGAEWDEGESGICAAFPDGIPLEIFAGGFDHRGPFAGDHGVRFAPVDSGAIERWEAAQLIMTPSQRTDMSDEDHIPERFVEDHDDVYDDNGDLLEPVDVDDTIEALTARLAD